MSKLITEFLSEMRPAIHRGEIIVSDKGDEYDSVLVSRFPFDLGRLQWHKLPQSRWRHRRAVQVNHENASRELLSQLPIELTAATPVVFIGDNLEGVTLEMSFGVFLRRCGILLSYPQHCYVFPPDGSWCFNYTFENDMYFGFGRDELSDART